MTIAIIQLIIRIGSLHRMNARIIFFILAFLFIIEISAAPARVESRFEPAVVNVGETTEYTLSIYNAMGGIEWEFNAPPELNVVGNATMKTFSAES